MWDKIIKYGKASNKLGEYVSKDFILLPFGLIREELPNLFSQNDIEGCVNLIMIHQYPNFNINDYSGNDVAAFILWIKEQHEHINNVEESLVNEPDPEMMAAGIHKLQPLGVLPTIDALAGGNILNYDKVRQMPYFEVYQKLKLDKINKEIEKAYMKIIEKKRH